MDETRRMFLEAKRSFGLFGFLLVLWGFYRLVFRFPEEVEELVLKPILWLGAVGVLLAREQRGVGSVGWTTKGVVKSIYLGLGLGMLFSVEGLVANIVKYGGVKFVNLGYDNLRFIYALVLSVATAVSEETVFRGYILSRLVEASKSRWFGIGVSSVMFVLIHMPIWLFVYKYTLVEILLQSIVLGIFSVGGGLLFTGTQSIVGPVLTHVVWGWAVVLFR